MKCPNCDKDVEKIDTDNGTPPWLCRPCRRGWWNAEMSPEARSAWQPSTQDWGESTTRIVTMSETELARQLAGKAKS